MESMKPHCGNSDGGTGRSHATTANPRRSKNLICVWASDRHTEVFIQEPTSHPVVMSWILALWVWAAYTGFTLKGLMRSARRSV